MIILEGCNGVGKTSYAHQLGLMLNARTYRAFRWGHDFRAEVDEMRNLGVPVNTFVDDFYTADLSRVLAQEIIMDRSLPSAVAYDGIDDSKWRRRLVAWNEILHQSLLPVILVWLRAPYDVARARMRGYVPTKAEYIDLDNLFAWSFAQVTLPTLCLDTSTQSIQVGSQRIVEFLCQQSKKSEVG